MTEQQFFCFNSENMLQPKNILQKIVQKLNIGQINFILSVADWERCMI